MRGIVSVQFLAAFNIFLGGDSELSRDAMSELFHNLSWQALTNDNDRYQIQFNAISVLVQSINQRLQRQVMNHRRKTKDVNSQITDALLSNVTSQNKTETENLEDKIVKDIINQDQTDYGRSSPRPTIKTEEEIDNDIIQENKDFLKTELAKNERDIQITIR